MGRFVLLTGTHVQGKRKFKPGDTVESDSRLDKLFPNKFERALHSKKKVTGTLEDSEEEEEVGDAKVEKVADKSRRKAVKQMMQKEEHNDDADAAAARRRKRRKGKNRK